MPVRPIRHQQPSRYKALLILFLVYIAWGSTYLGNKLSLEVAGPFLVSGARNILGGLVLALVLLVWNRRLNCPGWKDVVQHCAMALLVVLMTGSFIVWGQTQVTSAVAAIVSSLVPVFMILGGWLCAGEERPTAAQWAGMALGGTGVVLLARTQHAAGTSTLAGIAIVVIADVSWVAGSLYMKRHPLSSRLTMMESTSLLLLCGGMEALTLGILLGEHNALHWANLRPAVVAGFSWMVLGGSVLAYGCYLWLLQNVATPVAISYEYVTPVIALFLGAFVGGEVVTSSMLCASVLIIVSVLLVIRHRHGLRVYVRHYLLHKAPSRQSRS